MYTATWINRLEQFGAVDITLLLTDEKGLRPDARIDKNYHDAKAVDDAFLEAEAIAESEKEIARQDNAANEILAEAERLRKAADATVAQADAAEAKAVEVQKQIDEIKAAEAAVDPIDPGGVVDG